MVYRVVQWATGNVGAASLRAVQRNPHLQLVGAYVYSGEKAGKDVGELCGLGAVGVKASANADEIIAMPADCAIYNALGETRDPAACVDDICRLLASGKNVVSTAVSQHIHPDAMPEDVRARIVEACRAGGVSFHSSGINPGFAFEMLPIALSAVCGRIDHIHCVELVNMAQYTSKQIVHGAIGMGLPPDQLAYADREGPFHSSPWAASARLVEDAFGVKFDTVRVTRAKVVADRPIQCPWGVVDAGTVAARRSRTEGMKDGVSLFTWDLIWRVSDEVAPDWPVGDASWEVKITGEPTLHCRIDTESAEHRVVSVLTSQHAVNAIPAVIAAAPGIKTRLDLPVFAGGCFGR